MITNKHPLLIAPNFFLALAIGALGATPLSAAEPAPDSVQVVEAITTMYAAATNDDLAKFHTVTSPAFYAFDNGKQFAGDSLMNLVKVLHAGGNVYVWRVTEPKVHIEGNIAWITYINRGLLQNASGTKPMAWLESAVLRKEKGTWLIQFMHSTRVP